MKVVLVGLQGLHEIWSKDPVHILDHILTFLFLFSAKNGWSTKEANYVTITNQDESIKTKKITEKIDLESVAGIMASCF